MGRYNHHFNSQAMPKRVEPVRSSYYLPGSGILPLTLAEYVCIRLTGMLPRPRSIHDYPTAMNNTWKQVEFAVWTKEQEAAQTAPKPMPHQQAKANTFRRSPYGSHMGGLGGFATPFDSTQEDV